MKKKILKNLIILLIYYIPLDTTANTPHQHQYNTLQNIQPHLNKTPNHFTESQIIIHSNTVTINYPQQIQFSGNVRIQQNNQTLTSDKITILYNNNKNITSYTLHAQGHIHYNNNHIILTGQKAWLNSQNNNVNINQGTYYLIKSNFHGAANTIMQRKNNRYTIINHGYFTSCLTNDNYWNITGSKIMYDYMTNNIEIWHAYFKIKKIPILYIPYLFLSLNQENILTSYIPNIQYTNQYGLILKIPYPIYFSKNFSGSITPCYISNIGITLETKINYSTLPGTGIIILNIMKNNKIKEKISFKKHHYEKFSTLYWQHNDTVHKKWHFNIHYISNEYPKYSKISNIQFKHINIINNYINQKFICKYNQKKWNASIAYLGVTTNENKKNNHNNYIAAPQLILQSFNNYYIQKNLLTLRIFNQLTKFIPKNKIFPTATRIHTEPSIHYIIHSNYWSNLNIETKLKLTYYQQKNNNSYDSSTYTQYYLKNTISRIIPQFKIYGKIILINKKDIIKKHQHFLESNIQYLYIPYRFQENIGIYDTSIIHKNNNNLFNDFIYSGLDRITPANQIIGNIVIHYLHNTHELFYLSIGQILNLTSFQYINNNNKIYNKHTPSNVILLSSTSHWHITQKWHTYTEIQYNPQYHNIPFNITILEYKHKNNYAIQTHYRYVNAQYIQNILFNHSHESTYYQKITQLGILMYTSIHHNWKTSLSYYFNIKTKKPIDQTISLQYFTPCWNIDAVFERKIIGVNNTNKNNIYDNKIRLNFNISHLKNNFKANSCKILNMSMLPYQHIS